jgi:3-hydroxyisobutyrate dehydrogenase-like beta-hydroxyacid dehydrogenase
MKVAVVGLGIAGLSICARLALAGHDVSGFDQFEPMHTERLFAWRYAHHAADARRRRNLR